MHNIILKESGINAVYLPFCVKDRLEAVISGAHALGIKGLNITLPYKREVLNYLSEVDAEACEIGAVNTLVYQTNGYKGYNTDMCGLRKSVTDSEIDIKNNQKFFKCGENHPNYNTCQYEFVIGCVIFSRGKTIDKYHC